MAESEALPNRGLVDHHRVSDHWDLQFLVSYYYDPKKKYGLNLFLNCQITMKEKRESNCIYYKEKFI